jgi:hypothetical protein
VPLVELAFNERRNVDVVDNEIAYEAGQADVNEPRISDLGPA